LGGGKDNDRQGRIFDELSAGSMRKRIFLISTIAFDLPKFFGYALGPPHKDIRKPGCEALPVSLSQETDDS